MDIDMLWRHKKKNPNIKTFGDFWTWHTNPDDTMCPMCSNGKRWTVTAPDGHICGWVEKDAYYWIGIFAERHDYDTKGKKTGTERRILTYKDEEGAAQFVTADAAMKAFENGLIDIKKALLEPESEKNSQEDQGLGETQKTFPENVAPMPEKLKVSFVKEGRDR